MSMSQNVAGTVAEQYPLSPLQHGMLFHQVHSGRETGVDIEQLEARLHEAIDAADMERAWTTIAARHAVLRTRFRWEGLENPVQEVLSAAATAFELRDLATQPGSVQQTSIATFL